MKTKDKTTRRIIGESLWNHAALVVGFAILSRIVFFLLQRHADPLFLLPIVDEATYLADAKRWMASGFSYAGLTLPFWQPPGYMMLLAGWLGLGGTAASFVLLQSALGVATSWLIYVAVRRAFGEKARRAALWSALLFSACPLVLYFETKLLKPSCTMFLITALLCLSYPRGANRWWLFRGMLAGTLILFEAYFMVIPVVLLFETGWRHVRMAALVAGLALPLVPVSWLNASASLVMTPVSINGPINFYVGNNQHWVDTYNALPGWEWEKLTRRFDVEVMEGTMVHRGRDRAYMDEIRDYALQHPGSFVLGFLTKASLMFSPREMPRNGAIVMHPFFTALGWVINLILVAVLMLVVPRVWRDPMLIVLIVLVAAVCVGFFPTSRYRICVLPPLLVAAGALAPWSGISSRSKMLSAGLALLLSVVGAGLAARCIRYDDWRAFSLNEAAWMNLGRGRLDLAKQYMDEALAARRLPLVLNSAGQMTMGRGENPTGAMLLFEEAIQIDPGLPVSYLNRGRVQQSLGQTEAACASFDLYLDRLVSNQIGYSTNDADAFVMVLEYTARVAYDNGYLNESLKRLNRIKTARDLGHLPNMKLTGLDNQILQLKAQLNAMPGHGPVLVP